MHSSETCNLNLCVMKTSLMSAMLALAVLFGGVMAAGAQTRAQKKEAKKWRKELKKADWEMLAGTTTLEYATLRYRVYIDEDPENRIEMVGMAEGQNPKIGRENAIMNGITSYAGRARAQVVGKMKGIIASDATAAEQEEIDKFGAAYEMGVNTKIAGLVKQHFALVRELDNGKKEFMVYMSIDEKEAKKAREEAAAEARKQASLGTLSQQVDEFIGEPVDPD